MEFKERVEQFWKQFEEESYVFEQLLAINNYKVVRDKIVEMCEQLNTVKDVILSHNVDGTYDLEFLSENKLDMYINFYLTTFIPPHLFPKWNFYYTKLPVMKKGNFEFEDQLEAKLVLTAINSLVIKINTKDLPVTHKYIEGIVKYYLGEMMYETYITGIEYVDELEGETFLISDIREVVISVQEAEIVNYANSPFETLDKYEVEPGDNDLLRDDVIEWNSVVKEPYEAYINDDQDFFIEYDDVGITFGYLFATLDDFEENQEVSEELVTKILEILSSNQIALYLGNSLGNEYIYVDFIVFNKTEFTDAIKYEVDNIANFDIFYATLDNDEEAFKI